VLGSEPLAPGIHHERAIQLQILQRDVRDLVIVGASLNVGLPADASGLRHTNGTLIANSNTFDSKERVYDGSVGGAAIKLVVSGTSVTSDVEGCGTNSMRVWVTALIEDDARLDGDGPTWDATDKIGVQPL
jgi:hypothetical protein